MFSKTRPYDSTPAVLILMALFIFGLMAVLPPSCKCPKGFTYPQCNFTNMVCLTQTMYTTEQLREPFAHQFIRDGKQDTISGITRDSLHPHGKVVLTMSKAESGHVTRNNFAEKDSDRNIKEDVTSNVSKVQSTFKSKLLLYNSYPVIMFALAAVLSLPFVIWKYASIEKDILCILNTFNYAGREATDEKSRQRCVDQCVSDIKFFLRCFQGKLYRNVHRMYILKICVPFIALLCLFYILDINARASFTFNLTAMYSNGLETFPSNAMCHFNILGEVATRSYTTACTLPASPLLQLVTPLTMGWLTFLLAHGLYRYYAFRKTMSTANQNQFYRRYGFHPDTSHSVSPLTLFGNGGFLLFTVITKSDSANILREVMTNLRAPLERNPIER